MNRFLRWGVLLSMCSSMLVCPLASNGQISSQTLMFDETAEPIGSQTIAIDEAAKILSLEECLAYGMAHSPILRQNDGAILTAKGNLQTVKAAKGFKVNAQAAFNRQKQDSRRLPTANVGNALEQIDSNSDSVGVQQLLSDFGKTRGRIRSSQADLGAARLRRGWQEVLVASGIKTAYFRVLQAKALLEVQKEAVAQYVLHLEHAQQLVRVGIKPPYDATRAQSDLANARVALINAEGDVKNALSALAASMGLEEGIDVPEPVRPSNLSARELCHLVGAGEAVFDLSSLLDEAFRRPDVQAALAQVESSRHSLGVARKGLKPSLSGTAQYSWNGTAAPLDRSYAIGLVLSSPLADGGLTKGQIQSAQGTLDNARAKYEDLRISVRSDLETAITNVTNSLKKFEATQVFLQAASETLDIAEGRFQVGIGSSVDVQDARASYVSARGSNVSAYYASLTALTTLDQMIGRLPREVSAPNSAPRAVP